MFDVGESREETSVTTHTNQATLPLHTPFTAEETRALEAVRRRFQQDHDILSQRERRHLSFLRWLVRSGRLSL